MRRLLSLLLITPIIMVFAFTANGEEKKGMQHEKMPHRVMPNAVWYTCGCVDCGCNTLSDKPGKCICGRELVPMPILKIEGNKGYFCSCSPDCACKFNPKDPTRCTCGNLIKVIDLTGKYICECCNVISDKSGECVCGRELKKLWQSQGH